MGEQYRFSVSPEHVGLRIDKVLSNLFPDYSRSFLQNLIDEPGCVLVNNNTIKSNYKVKDGDSIFLEIPDPEPLDIVAEDIPLSILYEDDSLLVVNKPKGMVVHPSAGHISGTLVNALLYHCKDQLSSINGVLRPGIVHRIDMDTTGLLVVCKNDLAHHSLAEQLKEHSITRRYECIVHDNLKEDTGTINQPIGRCKTDRKKQAIIPDGKKAITHYTVLHRFSYQNKAYTHVECRLETGRTHQIRVHMASIRHPLLGDTIYGRGEASFAGIPLSGQVLHAGTLGFIHPVTNEYMEFHAELPEYFREILKKVEVQNP